jgi:ABC-type multidrug transport system ATPase subunit
MNESVVKALLRLFAIIANVDHEGVSIPAREIVKAYLEEHLNRRWVDQYLLLFDEYLKFHHCNFECETEKGQKRNSANAVSVLKIGGQINENLQQSEKIIILIRLLEFVNEDEIITLHELEFIETIVQVFNINEAEYHNCKALVVDSSTENIEKEKLLIIDGNESADDWALEESGDWFERNRPKALVKSKHIFNENLPGKIVVLHVESVNMFFFRYLGQGVIYLNDHNIIPKRTYLFHTGSLIKSPKIKPIYFSDVAAKFIQAKTSHKITFYAKDIEFRFKNSPNGVHKFSFFGESGKLIGIMGGSGVGKSTLLSVLNGSLPVDQGQILINGYDLNKDREKLHGVIGFVPQDDLLIEELTVYQNLYFNAKLCYSTFKEKQIHKIIDEILLELDLFDIKNLTVGNSLNKFISGGQRKRLNIALELLREPSILIVDEPTSGLSSSDSEIVMFLLKEQSNQGRMVIVNIHQPSSDIFKQFDKLLILDRGGYPVYYGHPIDGVIYFKTIKNHVDASDRECIACGNVNPEQILNIIEARELNEYGRFTHARKVMPKEWYELFLKNQDKELEDEEFKHKFERKLELPKQSLSIPSYFDQLKIFSKRNLLSKLTNKQYTLISLLEAPLLALILGFFSKYNHGSATNPMAYIFAENTNIPAYLFMMVIVALFLGLTVSAEEIIKDQRILKRESFLNLSKASYLHSKIIYLFSLSAIQTISFILVGNTILGIHGMTLNYWLILFSTSCFANMLGLNISSGLNSVVTIYILIPFILVPQLLLSGVIVDFNKLHKSVTSPSCVPAVGDIMTSRWAYEALAVEQFKNNKFNINFFPFDQKMSESSFKFIYHIPRLETLLDQCERNIAKKQNQPQTMNNFKLIQNEIKLFPSEIPYSSVDSLTISLFNNKVYESTKKYFADLMKFYNDEYKTLSIQKDSVYNTMMKQLSKEGIVKLQQDYHNKRLDEFVKNKMDFNKIEEYDNRLVQLIDPIYHIPEKNNGRAHFYAPVKKLFGQYYDTYWFNISFIWMTIVVLYFTLHFELLRKALNNVYKGKHKKIRTLKHV